MVPLMSPNAVFPKSRFLRIGQELHDFSTPKIMGILNTTPDSFYEKSRAQSTKDILIRATQLHQEGASILDLGAHSTRPGAPLLRPEEEIARLKDVLPLIRQDFPTTLLSLDTFHAEVADFGLSNGINLINDISAGQFDANLWEVVAAHKAPYVLTYNRAPVQNEARSFVSKGQLVMDALHFLSNKLEALYAIGIQDVLIDPGFGFGKSLAENFELLDQLETLHLLEHPLLIGVSRKSMITKSLNCTSEEALNGTTTLNTLAYTKGARIFRVHDVAAAKEALTLLQARVF
ncbi:MAG: hypothetical protein RLZZ301_966 [Bacteroidota bacterium]|jgi:dihydropteroate synthase